MNNTMINVGAIMLFNHLRFIGAFERKMVKLNSHDIPLVSNFLRYAI